MKNFLPTHGLRGILILGILLPLASCYPGEITDAAQLDTVITSFVEEYNFGTNRTYAMPDTIIHLTEDGEDSDILTREHDAVILARVAQNMADLGYDRITNPDTLSNKPDVAVIVQASASTTYVVGTYPPGWGWGGWWPDYPCCYGPGYPGWWYEGSYEVGTLFIDYFDVDDYLAEEDVNLVWEGLVNGLLTGSSGSIESRLNTNIDQAFEQSPYLSVGGDQ